jgi:hypothetical protein
MIISVVEGVTLHNIQSRGFLLAKALLLLDSHIKSVPKRHMQEVLCCGSC